jgi:hypothetical protein
MSDAPSQTTEVQPEVQEMTLAQKISGSFMLLFLLAWVLGGIGALIMSLVCFGFSGTMTEKIIGLALAFFLGPLYFIFYAFNKDYCRNLGANVMKSANQFVPSA